MTVGPVPIVAIAAAAAAAVDVEKSGMMDSLAFVVVVEAVVAPKMGWEAVVFYGWEGAAVLDVVVVVDAAAWVSVPWHPRIDFRLGTFRFRPV